jgi:hypothetical protein
VWRLTLIALVCLLPLGSRAQYVFEDPPELDHRDQWGLRLEPGATLFAATDVREASGRGLVGSLEVGLSRGLPHTGHEISVRVRPLLLGRPRGLLFLGGYRAYAGLDHWKTFADLDLLVPVVPGPSAGVRVGAGVMYDPTRYLGVSLSGGAFAAIGRAMVSGFDLAAGLQIRFD